MKKVELLAPAGNMESLKAAVSGGCNAVYLGLKSFSARAFAGNFSHAEFIDAVHYCHTRDVKVYCTINTMLFETEIENAKQEVEFLYQNDCDAILVQDLGLFHYIRTCYPDFPVHCSTQMHIHNLKGVEFMEQEGVERIVLARETPIEIIREACKKNVEIEVFVYGAVCISYSGECFMSESIKKRSANRGMCAQCCRLQYLDKDSNSFKEGSYVLYPKDLNVIDRLDELLDAGVASLKIEGRMKRPEYVYLVIKTFREAIEHYYNHKKYKVSSTRQEELKLMFNRGFSEGHMFHANVKDRMSQYRPNHQGIEIGKVLSYKPGKVQIKLSKPLYQQDGLRIIHKPHDTGIQVNKIYKNDLLVNHADAGDVVWLTCPKEYGIHQGQSVHKTTDIQLIEKIDTEIKTDISIPIHVRYKAIQGKPLKVTFLDERGNSATAYSNVVCEVAKNAPLTSDKIERSLCKTNEYPYVVQKIDREVGNIFIPVSSINQVRRDALELFDKQRSIYRHNCGFKPYKFHLEQHKPPKERILVETDVLQHISLNSISFFSHDSNNDSVLPVVNEKNDLNRTYEHCILSSVADLNNTLVDCICGCTMNLSNSYAVAYVLSKGVSAVILSTEMKNEQIKQMLEAFKLRYDFLPYTYRMVYGKRNIMYIKDCFIENKPQQILDLSDRIYDIKYLDNLTIIKEPDIYVSSNPYCYGSYLILDKKGEEEIGEAYEEIFGRV